MNRYNIVIPCFSQVSIMLPGLYGRPTLECVFTKQKNPKRIFALTTTKKEIEKENEKR